MMLPLPYCPADKQYRPLPLSVWNPLLCISFPSDYHKAPEQGTVLVDGVNVVTKAQKANPMAGVQGGLNKIAKPIDASKVMICCPSCDAATRVKHEVVDGKKVRVCKKCGKTIDV